MGVFVHEHGLEGALRETVKICCNLYVISHSFLHKFILLKTNAFYFGLLLPDMIIKFVVIISLS